MLNETEKFKLHKANSKPSAAHDYIWFQPPCSFSESQPHFQTLHLNHSLFGLIYTQKMTIYMKISWNHFKITQNQAILYKCANATSVVKIKMRTRCSPWALRHDIFSGANFQVLKQYKLCTFLKVTIFLEIDQIIFFFFSIFILLATQKWKMGFGSLTHGPGVFG